MSVNRNEAMRYLDLAQTLILNGQLEKGLKLCYKAQHLFPNELGLETIRRVEALMAKRNNQASSTESAPKPSATPSSRPPPTTTNTPTTPKSSPITPITKSPTSTPPTTPPSPKFTSEQVQLIQSILNHPDNFYAALGVERTASSVEIKKAYRKIVLLIHPDKNFAPGAAEAFKIVSRAFTILSDQEKRTQYDIFGTKKPESFPRQRRQPPPSTRFQSQEQFEDFFRQFNQRPNHYGFESDEWPYAQPTQPTTANQPAFLSFLTLSILLGAFFLGLSYLMAPTPMPKTKLAYPQFTFPKANEYHPHAFQTRKNGVSYVVSPWKMKEFRNQVTARQFKKFEKEVERQYSKWLIKNKN